jgi:hypothetical protein
LLSVIRDHASNHGGWPSVPFLSAQLDFSPGEAMRAAGGDFVFAGRTGACLTLKGLLGAAEADAEREVVGALLQLLKERKTLLRGDLSLGQLRQDTKDRRRAVGTLALVLCTGEWRAESPISETWRAESPISETFFLGHDWPWWPAVCVAETVDEFVGRTYPLSRATVPLSLREIVATLVATTGDLGVHRIDRRRCAWLADELIGLSRRDSAARDAANTLVRLLRWVWRIDSAPEIDIPAFTAATKKLADVVPTTFEWEDVTILVNVDDERLVISDPEGRRELFRKDVALTQAPWTLLVLIARKSGLLDLGHEDAAFLGAHAKQGVSRLNAILRVLVPLAKGQPLVHTRTMRKRHVWGYVARLKIRVVSPRDDDS